MANMQARAEAQAEGGAEGQGQGKDGDQLVECGVRWACCELLSTFIWSMGERQTLC